MKEKSFNFSNPFKKKGNDKFESLSSDHRDSEEKKKIYDYDQKGEFSSSHSGLLIEEHQNDENLGESSFTEDEGTQEVKQKENEEVPVNHEDETGEAILSTVNIPIHTYEVEKEEEFEGSETMTEYDNSPPTHSEKDEIEKLRNYIAKLESENVIIPALKAEMENLKEKIEERKQETTSQSDSVVWGEEVSLATTSFELKEMVYEGFVKLENKLGILGKEFNTKLVVDEGKEKIIDNLHRELQLYKDDQIKDIVKPLINDLILMSDRTRKIVEGFEKDEELYPKKLLRILNDCVQDIEDILYRQGVESFTSDSETFDIKRQQIVKTIKTDDSSKDKKIAEITGKGYEWDGKLLRHEKVNVFVFEKQKA
ncbi:nucleotide exchange factor GrpE [Peribacillus sp. JNUCC 23]